MKYFLSFPIQKSQRIEFDICISFYHFESHGVFYGAKEQTRKLTIKKQSFYFSTSVSYVDLPQNIVICIQNTIATITLLLVLCPHIFRFPTSENNPISDRAAY